MPQLAENLLPISVINQSGVLLYYILMCGVPKKVDYGRIVRDVIRYLKESPITVSQALSMATWEIKVGCLYNHISQEEKLIIHNLTLANKKERRPKNKTYLGKLCPNGHDHKKTGKSLRYKSNSSCVTCHNQRNNRNLMIIDDRHPKNDILTTFPIISDAHYLGRLCPNLHKYHGFNYSLRYKCNKVCIYCHRNNLNLGDITTKLNGGMASRINESLKGRKNRKHWEDIVGYTIEDLKTHLESQFTLWMSWDNYGQYWHIDHKKPKSLFKFTSYEDDEFKRCWSLNNLQPLEADVNLRKGNKLYKEYAHL